MRSQVFFLLLMSIFGSTASYAGPPSESFYDLKANDIAGHQVLFSNFRGKVVLVVNTASQCGFTPQLKDLETLNKKYAAQGLVVLGFPSNDFKQESADPAEVQKFAAKEYGITFQLFEKGAVSGKQKQPVFDFLINKKSGFIFKEVAWNFEKFLINRKGEVVERWSSVTSPTSDSIIKSIEKELK